MTASQVNQETTARCQEERTRDEASTNYPVTMSTTVPRVPQPIFAIVNAPLIADVSREALLEWLRLRGCHRGKMQSGAANEDVKAVMRSVRSSFDENLLETMCETRWDADLESVTDEFLMEKVRKITASFKNKELPDMEELFGNELKLNESISDVEARVTAYFHLANEIIKRNGVADLFTGEDGIKRKCKVLMKFLPGPLSKKVANELEYRSGEAKASVRSLYKVVSNLALELEKENKAVMQMRAKMPKPTKPFSTRGPMKITPTRKSQSSLAPYQNQSRS